MSRSGEEGRRGLPCWTGWTGLTCPRLQPLAREEDSLDPSHEGASGRTLFVGGNGKIAGWGREGRGNKVCKRPVVIVLLADQIYNNIIYYYV